MQTAEQEKTAMYMRWWRATPSGIASIRKYQESEKGCANQRRKNTSTSGRAKKRRFDVSEKGKMRQKRQNASAAGKERQKRYLSSGRGKAANKTKCANRQALRKGAVGTHTANEWLALLDAYHGLCAYCHRKATARDHVVPLVRAGSNFIDNIVPACGSCNSSKRDTLLLVWMAQRARGRAA